MKHKIRYERVTEEITNLFGRIKDVRKDMLTDIINFQVGTRSILQREAYRLEKKFGTEHPRVQQAKARLELNKKIIYDLENEKEIGKINVPDVDKDDVLIHGRVMDERFKGIEGLTVYTEDAARKRITALGSSETTGSGYYSLVIDRDTAERVVKEKEVFVTVRTAGDKLVHRHTKPLRLSVGGRLLVEVTLTRDSLRTVGRPRGSPTRKPAEPPVKTKGRKKEVHEKVPVLKLESIKGIRPEDARRLRTAGIVDVKGFTTTSEAQLKEILGDVDVRKMKREGRSLLKKIEESARKRKKK